MKPAIVVLDIETAPEVAYIWRRYDESVGQNQIVSDGYIMCACWSFIGDDGATSIRCNGSSDSRHDLRYDDGDVVRKLWRVLDAADVVVGHNLRRFDIPTINARFIKHGLRPPSPYKIVDTYEVIRKKLKIGSNSLESASHFFELETGPKVKQGFALWRDCLNGSRDAWKRMVEYCAQDVLVTKALYLKLLPWIEQHPNYALYSEGGERHMCPNCGGTDFQRRGKARTNTRVYLRVQCKGCGKWSKAVSCEKRESRAVLTDIGT